MQIRLIIGQYNCSYPGELAPNVLDAWDEYTLEDNWKGYEERLKDLKAQVGTDFEAVRELVIDVPEAAIDRLFADQTPTAKATVVE